MSRRVLVACEFSGVVRRAFRERGFDAWSCDLLPAEDGSEFHIQGSVLPMLRYGATFDLMIAHPPCTHLAVSGARWFKDKQVEQEEALDFVRQLLAAPFPHIALENPISIISSRIRKPDQIVQPFWFGDPYRKSTCLWLKNLPPLVPTNNVRAEMDEMAPKDKYKIHYASPGPDRWKVRSVTPAGLANAMASQWGDYITRAEAA